MQENTQPRDPISFVPIGIIHTPYTDLSGMPIQAEGGRGVRGSIEIFPEYADGLRDLDGFSHIILLYAFHRSSSPRLTLTPYLDTVPRGVFATRAPVRPNPIGMTIVRLTGVDGTALSIEDLDILDGTPLLDIKPYIPLLDAHPGATSGWFARNASGLASFRSDGRFT